MIVDFSSGSFLVEQVEMLIVDGLVWYIAKWFQVLELQLRTSCLPSIDDGIPRPRESCNSIE